MWVFAGEVGRVLIFDSLLLFNFYVLFFSILFQILFPLRLLQIIEQNSLCFTVGPCWLSILNIAVAIELLLVLLYYPFNVREVEVGHRCAPGLDSWCPSSGVKFKLCSHPDTPRTKLVAKTELCQSKE